ncbi:MAG: hypothetical protein OK449_03315 [Thaumarchaeota archaeon]|nr:hypothetical protein [Nitrososphaerota archaeon]
MGQQPSQAAAPPSGQTSPSDSPVEVSPAPAEAAKPEVPLTEEQIAAGDRNLTSAVLNLLFWGVGYYNAGIKRPFGRSWLIWPIIYIIYAFVGQVLAFTSLLAGESITTTTVPIGNSTTSISIAGYNPFPNLQIKELELVALIIPGIILGLFLARDVYRRSAAASPNPASVPGIGAAIRSVIQRSTKPITAENIEREPAIAFSLVGGFLLILGSLYLMGLDWLSSQTFNIGGIKELEGVVLAALIIYLTLMLKSRPSWRQPAGIFIIAIALIELTMSTEYVVELGFGIAIIGGALMLASRPEPENK